MSITGGYELRDVQTWDGGRAFAAELYRDGTLLGRVYNAGRTGGTALSLPAEEQHRFEETARHATGQVYGAVEVFVRRLLDVADLNRRRTRVVLVDDMDYFTDRKSLSMPSQVPARTLASILSQQGRTNIRVWDKQATDFVPLAA